MAKLYNLAAMTVASTGTGTITLGAAATINGVLYLSFAAAGAADGETVAYSINDVGGSEVGTGVYTAAGTTLTRTPVTSTNANAAINMTSAAIVKISPAAEDIANLRQANTFSLALATLDATNFYIGSLTLAARIGKIQGVGSGSTIVADIDSYGGFPVFTLRRANGTIGSPTQVLSADIMATFGFRGYHSGSAFGTVNVCQVRAVALENFTSTQQGARLDLLTTPAGGTATAIGLTVHGSGGVSIGSTVTDPGFGLIYTNSASFLIRSLASYTNGAGVGAGTITNAPAAGNPTKWIPVDDNGTTRYIPAW